MLLSKRNCRRVQFKINENGTFFSSTILHFLELLLSFNKINAQNDPSVRIHYLH